MIFINFTSTFFSFWEDFAEDPGNWIKQLQLGHSQRPRRTTLVIFETFWGTIESIIDWIRLGIDIIINHCGLLYTVYIYICVMKTHPSYKAPKRDSQSPFSPGFWHWISHQLWNLRSWQLAKTAVRWRGALQMWKVVRLRDLSLTKTSGSGARKLSERIQDFRDSVPIFPSKNGGFKVPGSLSDWTHQRSCLSGVLVQLTVLELPLWNLVS